MIKDRVAVVGAGSIGVAFCVLFAQSGFKVALADPVPGALTRARKEVGERLEILSRHDLLTSSIPNISGQIEYFERMADAVTDCSLVQECAPESLALKRHLFEQLAATTSDETVLATSSSALTSSQIVDEPGTRSRALVGHPGNPPYLLPIIEVVPSPDTATAAIKTAETIYRDAGLHPVLVQREIEGFIFNRLQGAVLREAYSLVRDDVASVEDIDAVMRLGLGRRWSVIGPFETSDLNTRGGIESHAQKMGPAYARMGAERGQDDPWTPELVREVTRQRRAILPLNDWDARVAWRDEQLASIRTREVAGA